MTGRPGIRRLAADEGGFSLIELLTAMLILLIVISSLAILMTSATAAEVDLTERVRVQQQARVALERMRHEIHRACKAEHMTLATGAPVVPVGAHSNVRLTPAVVSVTPSVFLECPTTTNPATAITWCMEPVSTNRWKLRRVVGTPTSCTGGSPVVDYLTTDAVFTHQKPAGRLESVKVRFPIDLKPFDVSPAYRLEDNLVLRNALRAP